MGSIEPFFLSGRLLPGMPELARQLIATYDDEATDLDMLVTLFGQDHSLALRLRQLAQNGASDASAHTALLDVARHLGLTGFRNLGLSASLKSAFPAAQGLESTYFWTHSMATAGYAHWLGRLLGVDPDSAFLSGFLLRTGQLLLAQTMPQVVAQVESESAVPGSRMRLERRLVGFSHSAVTAELARRWHLPIRIIEGFANADSPLAAEPFSWLAAVLGLASTMADAGMVAQPMGLALKAADPALLNQLRLDPAWIESIAPSFADLTAPVSLLLS
jgi:HD-like signal output (HDOD) protein